ncbi:MAG: zinc-dependent metalloprotease [Nitriliruptorales bacterium]|nr:zinc-dependent metalloprotease [Nitriliruptorales bacterium]
MSGLPDPDDFFSGLPDELRQMLNQFAGSGGLQNLGAMLGGETTTGPVNWQLARRAAMEKANEGDHAPTDDDRERFTEAQQVAEHWLDDSTLPAPPDAGQLLVASRHEWIDAALTSMRPMIEPVAAASTRAMGDLTEQQLGSSDLDAMGLGPFAELLGGLDLGEMMRPVGAMLAGLQAGQVIGQLSRQLLGQFELGVPTAPRSTAVHLVPNIEETFAGWELDAMEIAVSLALVEGAHRRLYHAVPWLEAHLYGLIAQFANGTEIDPRQLEEMAQDLMLGLDPDDPDAMREAMAKAGQFRLEPTDAQRRVLERLQGVMGMVGAWARREIQRAAGERLPNKSRIDEVLRRRRATKGSGEELLEQLLGLDLKPADESIADLFVATVEDRRGPAILRRALAHPENLPDTAELAEPELWLQRMEAGDEIPDDASELFGDLLDAAPVEPSAQERLDAASPDHEPDADDDPDADRE